MRVSIIMPVYNAEATVLHALESLKNQHFPSMEIIVVNDGSTDGTLKILQNQRNIKLLDSPHRGIVPALNDGIAAACGDYIARMDADDRCHPERIEQQAAFLDAFPEIGLVGCRVKFGGDREKQAGYAAHVDWINGLIEPADIALNRFIESPFAHPSVLFRRTLPEQYGAYRDGAFPEDYELWLRWMAQGVKAGKVNRELLTWNDPPHRLSRTDPRYDTDAFYETKAEYLFKWLEEHNPHHPEVTVWGAGRVTRKRVAILEQYGIRIVQYVDIKPRQLNCGTPVILPQELPSPDRAFLLSMVGKRGARAQIRSLLEECGFTEGVDCIFAA